MMGPLAVAVAAAFGSAAGSFCAAAAWRLPRHMSLVSPGSACPHCGTPIPWRWNIPVVGWLMLRGRARCCGERISVLYPATEAATGGLWALLAAITQPVWLLAIVLPASAAAVCAAAMAFIRPSPSWRAPRQRLIPYAAPRNPKSREQA